MNNVVFYAALATIVILGVSLGLGIVAAFQLKGCHYETTGCDDAAIREFMVDCSKHRRVEACERSAYKLFCETSERVCL